MNNEDLRLKLGINERKRVEKNLIGEKNVNEMIKFIKFYNK